MLEPYDHLEIARITARQAIVVALISATAAVVTTLAGTKAMTDSHVDSVNTTIEALKQQVAELTTRNEKLQKQLDSGQSAPANPPSMSQAVDTYDLPLAVCSDRAARTLSVLGLTSVGHTSIGAYGFTGQYSVAVACYPQFKVVDFEVAGPEPSTILDLINRTRSAFRGPQ